MDIDSIKRMIIEKLKPLDPEKVILFGSYAYGTQTDESDIDLYVVTKDKTIPKDFNEKMQLKLKVAYMIDDLRSLFPVDLIVHTSPMGKKFIELNSGICREIFDRGIKLL